MYDTVDALQAQASTYTQTHFKMLGWKIQLVLIGNQVVWKCDIETTCEMCKIRFVFALPTSECCTAKNNCLACFFGVVVFKIFKAFRFQYRVFPPFFHLMITSCKCDRMNSLITCFAA